MPRLRRSIVCAVLIVLAYVPGRIQAAQPSSPFRDMLARVPDQLVNRGVMYFSDWSAVEAAYPPAKIPTSVAQLQMSKDTSDAPTKVWWTVAKDILSPSLSTIFLKEQEMKKTVGFGALDVRQALDYGDPPQNATQYRGEFDLDTVRSALGAADFKRADRSDVELWCGLLGCEAGNQSDVKARNIGNPFGGSLGRHQPILIGENYLISSPSSASIDMHITALTGKGASLADNPLYRAAVEAVTPLGILIQARVIDGKYIQTLTGADNLFAIFAADPKAPKEKLAQALEDELKTYQTLPQYELILLADVVTETEQVGSMALVYSNVDDAQKASEILPIRIKAYTTRTWDKPLMDTFRLWGIDQVQTQIIENATAQRAVLLLKFVTPKATTKQLLAPRDPLAAPEFTAPGTIFRKLFDMFMAKDVNWLSTIPRETLEKQLAALKK